MVGSRQQLAKVSINSIKVGEANVTLVSAARNLGAWLDSHLDMSTHVSKTCRSACYYLYNIRHIRKFLSREHVLNSWFMLSSPVDWTTVIGRFTAFSIVR